MWAVAHKKLICDVKLLVTVSVYRASLSDYVDDLCNYGLSPPTQRGNTCLYNQRSAISFT